MRSQTVPTQVSIPLTFPLKTQPNSSLTEMISRVMQETSFLENNWYIAAAEKWGKFSQIIHKILWCYVLGSCWPWVLGSVGRLIILQIDWIRAIVVLMGIYSSKSFLLMPIESSKYP